MSKARWQSLLKCFYVLPVGSFVMWLVAIVYYGGHRPHTPQPESAQIVLLPWTHPAVYVSPHNSAASDPDAVVAAIARQIEAFERGEPLRNVVDRRREY